MPTDAIPFIGFIVAAFSIFMVAVGGVWIWTNLPDKRR